MSEQMREIELPPLPIGPFVRINHDRDFVGYSEVFYTAEQMREYALAALATQPQAPQGGEWQPIETAPKDGTEVLGFRGDAGVFVMRWIAPVDFLTERELADPYGEDRDWEEEPDWFYADFIQGGRLDGAEAPTHWMPLPLAPTETPEAEK